MKKNLLLLIVISTLAANTANGQWVSNGPDGGEIWSVTARGSEIFAGSEGGLYVSTNNGAGWKKINNGIGNEAPVSCMAFSGSNIFAATVGDGIFISSDDGNSWTPINSGLTPNPGYGVFAVITMGSAVFIGTGGYGVLLSTDNGNSWTPVNTGLTNNAVVKALAVSGSNIFAGTGDGIFLSSDTGKTWTAVNMGLTNTTVNALTISGSNIYAGTAGGVFLSTDNGGSWTAANSGITYPLNITSFAINGDNIFATGTGAVYLSTDNATSWTALTSGLPANVPIYSIAIGGAGIFAGTLAGMYLSTNNGLNWTPADSGIIGVAMDGLAVSGYTVFTGGYGAVYSSNNDGDSWTALPNGLPDDSYIQAWAVSGSHIFLGVQYAGIYLSADNGSTWAPANSGLPAGGSVYSIVVCGSYIFAALWESGVYVSTDNGGTWTLASTGLPTNEVTALTSNGKNVFAGTFGDGIYMSSDSGGSWQAVNNNLGYEYIHCLASSGSIIAAGAGLDLYISINNGGSWTEMNTGFPTNTVINSLTIYGSDIFAGTDHNGVYLSTDTGAFWTPINYGLPPYTTVNSIGISDSNIFLCTTAGVWQQYLSTITCNLAQPIITSEANIICAHDSTKICAPPGFAIYQWNTGDTGNCAEVKQSGSYYVVVVDSNGCKAWSDTNTISVYPSTSVTISAHGDTLLVPPYLTYQWYLNDTMLIGDTGEVYITTGFGSYTVAITDSNGCTAISSPLILTGINALAEEKISLYPNPNSIGNWRLTVGAELIGSTAILYNDEGKLISRYNIGNTISEITADIPAGIYWLRITSGNASTVRKLVKI